VSLKAFDIANEKMQSKRQTISSLNDIIPVASRRWEFNLNLSTPEQLEMTSSLKLQQYQLHSETTSSHSNERTLARLRTAKVWEAARSPISTIFMTLFMSWMSGSNVNIFSIMITVYSFINPIKAILSVNEVFSRFEDHNSSLFLPKLTYIGINLVTLSIAVYKCSVLGLLPTTVSDWISYLPMKRAMEYSVGFTVC